MPDLIRHPVVEQSENTLESGSRPEWQKSSMSHFVNYDTLCFTGMTGWCWKVVLYCCRLNTIIENWFCSAAGKRCISFPKAIIIVASYGWPIELDIDAIRILYYISTMDGRKYSKTCIGRIESKYESATHCKAWSRSLPHPPGSASGHWLPELEL